jgi:hypothetical protein
VRCKIHTKFWPENLKEIENLENKNVDGRTKVTSIVAYFLKAAP